MRDDSAKRLAICLAAVLAGAGEAAGVRGYSTSEMYNEKLGFPGLPICYCENYRNGASTLNVGKMTCAKTEVHGLSGRQLWCQMPNNHPWYPLMDSGCPGDYTRCKVANLPPDVPACSCSGLVNGASPRAEFLCQKYEDGVCRERNPFADDTLGNAEFYNCAQDTFRCDPHKDAGPTYKKSTYDNRLDYREIVQIVERRKDDDDDDDDHHDKQCPEIHPQDWVDPKAASGEWFVQQTTSTLFFEPTVDKCYTQYYLFDLDVDKWPIKRDSFVQSYAEKKYGNLLAQFIPEAEQHAFGKESGWPGRSCPNFSMDSFPKLDKFIRGGTFSESTISHFLSDGICVADAMKLMQDLGFSWDHNQQMFVGECVHQGLDRYLIDAHFDRSVLKVLVRSGVALHTGWNFMKDLGFVFNGNFFEHDKSSTGVIRDKFVGIDNFVTGHNFEHSPFYELMLANLPIDAIMKILTDCGLRWKGHSFTGVFHANDEFYKLVPKWGLDAWEKFAHWDVKWFKGFTDTIHFTLPKSFRWIHVNELGHFESHEMHMLEQIISGKMQDHQFTKLLNVGVSYHEAVVIMRKRGVRFQDGEWIGHFVPIAKLDWNLDNIDHFEGLETFIQSNLFQGHPLQLCLSAGLSLIQSMDLMTLRRLVWKNGVWEGTFSGVVDHWRQSFEDMDHFHGLQDFIHLPNFNHHPLHALFLAGVDVKSAMRMIEHCGLMWVSGSFHGHFVASGDFLKQVPQWDQRAFELKWVLGQGTQHTPHWRDIAGLKLQLDANYLDVGACGNFKTNAADITSVRACAAGGGLERGVEVDAWIFVFAGSINKHTGHLEEGLVGENGFYEYAIVTSGDQTPLDNGKCAPSKNFVNGGYQLLTRFSTGEDKAVEQMRRFTAEHTNIDVHLLKPVMQAGCTYANSAFKGRDPFDKRVIRFGQTLASGDVGFTCPIIVPQPKLELELLQGCFFVFFSTKFGGINPDDDKCVQQAYAYPLGLDRFGRRQLTDPQQPTASAATADAGRKLGSAFKFEGSPKLGAPWNFGAWFGKLGKADFSKWSQMELDKVWPFTFACWSFETTQRFIRSTWHAFFFKTTFDSSFIQKDLDFPFPGDDRIFVKLINTFAKKADGNVVVPRDQFAFCGRVTENSDAVFRLGECDIDEGKVRQITPGVLFADWVIVWAGFWVEGWMEGGHWNKGYLTHDWRDSNRKCYREAMRNHHDGPSRRLDLFDSVCRVSQYEIVIATGGQLNIPTAHGCEAGKGFADAGLVVETSLEDGIPPDAVAAINTFLQEELNFNTETLKPIAQGRKNGCFEGVPFDLSMFGGNQQRTRQLVPQEKIPTCYAGSKAAGVINSISSNFVVDNKLSFMGR